MTTLSFKCSHAASFAEPAGPVCGRAAIQRACGDARCIGHCLVDYLVANWGSGLRAKQAARATTFFMAVLAFAEVCHSVIAVFGGGDVVNSVLLLGYSVPLLIYMGSGYVALEYGSSISGRAWLVSAPVVAAAILLFSVFDPRVLWPASTSKLVGALETAGGVVAALYVLTTWLVFWTTFFGRRRRGVVLVLSAEILSAGYILAAIALAVVSAGEETDPLVILVVVLGIGVVVRATDRVARLVRRLQV